MDLASLVVPFRVVVASPSDVPGERDSVSQIADELNRGLAAELCFRLEVLRWETDTYPGFHAEGPQGLIDSMLRINECDLLVGVFWKRFGTQVADAESGTEHEFRVAYQEWASRGRPQIMVYFNTRPYTPASKNETDQWGRVLQFREEFPKEGLWWAYNGARQFERLFRHHLTMLLRRQAANAKVTSEHTSAHVEERESGAALTGMSVVSPVVGQVLDLVMRSGLNRTTSTRGCRELYSLYKTINRLADCSDSFIELLEKPDDQARIGSLVERYEKLAARFEEFADASNACVEPLEVFRSELSRELRELFGMKRERLQYWMSVLNDSAHRLKSAHALVIVSAESNSAQSGWVPRLKEDAKAISLCERDAVEAAVKDARVRIEMMRDLNARLAEFIRQNCDFNDLF